MQLTQEILCAYLPYEVGVQITDMGIKGELVGIILDSDRTIRPLKIRYDSDKYMPKYMVCFYEEAKLLLRPLSQLTQEIEHKGERFVPIYKIREMARDINQGYINVYDDLEIEVDDEYRQSFISILTFQPIVNYLHSLHFDLYGLLDNGLAIDKSIK